MKDVELINVLGEEYLLVSEVTYDNEKFGFLIDVLDNSKVLFVHFEDNTTINVLKDDEFIKKLIPLFIGNQDYI